MKTSFIAGVLTAFGFATQAGISHAGLTALVEVPVLGQSIYTFESTTPGVGTLAQISGLMGGESLLAIDYRPLTSQLYGLSTGNSVYTINVTSGAATIVGSGFGGTMLAGTNFGFDFNPQIDRIRIVSDTGQNLVANPITGTAAPFTPVFYPVGDPNAGATPNVVHHAYNNNFAGTGSTQLFAIDTNLNILVTQANSAGTLGTVGALGFDVGANGGFDVQNTGTAFGLFQDGINTSTLYTINLGTGAATNIGTVPYAAMGLSATAVPEPSTMLFLGAVFAGTAFRKRRLLTRKLMT